MNRSAELFFFIILFFLPELIYSQEQNTDRQLIQKEMKTADSLSRLPHPKTKFLLSVNPLKDILAVPLFFYQAVISEQVSANCEFDMSCSHFAFNSLREFGLLKGVFMAADRLTRCNGHAQFETENFLIDNQSGKVIDDPGMYRFSH